MGDRIGYSRRMANAINNTVSDSIGTKLGKMCVAKGYSVLEVAEVLNVSRQTVYCWMLGKYVPGKRHAEKIRELIEKLDDTTADA